MTGPAALPDDEELLAAELALGLIEREARGAAEARLASDPGFAAAVDYWREQGALMLAAEDEMPPASLWRAIAARLPANDAAPVAATNRWRTAAIAASLVAAVLGVAELRRPPPSLVQPAPAPLLALLTSTAGDGVVAVSLDPRSRRLATVASGLALRGRVPELWVIPVGGTPRSLGVIRADAAGARVTPDRLAALIVPGATLAITAEAPGGSPTGKPSGAPILAGIVAAG